MMRDSVISGFIVIPCNFEALLVGGQGKAAVAPIQVIVSGGEPNTANFIRGYSQGVIANWPADPHARRDHPEAARRRGPALLVQPGGEEPLVSGARLHHHRHDAHRDHAHGLGHCPRVRTGNDGIPFRHARDPDVQILLGKLIPYYFLGMFSIDQSVALAGVLPV